MVYCTKCGAENQNDAKYCQNCGESLKAKENYEEKRPLVSAGLNLLIAGLGFVYLKEYPKALLSFVIVVIGALIGGWILAIIALFLVMVWSYIETDKINSKSMDGN